MQEEPRKLQRLKKMLEKGPAKNTRAEQRQNLASDNNCCP